MPQQRIDIRKEKSELRERYKEVRRTMPEEVKQACNQKIFRRLIELWSFRDNSTVFCYVSGAIEVDTRLLIQEALERGKRIAVPRCRQDRCDMDFHSISSLADLSPGAYGILEPEGSASTLVTDFSDGLCIVPMLVLDRQGYRIGFGKGYYDRFLARFHGTVLGLCYENSIVPQMPHGKYDSPIHLAVTEKRVLRF